MYRRFLEYETLLLLQARRIHTEKMKPQDPKDRKQVVWVLKEKAASEV